MKVDEVPALIARLRDSAVPAYGLRDEAAAALDSLLGQLRLQERLTQDWRRQAMEAAKMLATPVLGPARTSAPAGCRGSENALLQGRKAR